MRCQVIPNQPKPGYVLKLYHYRPTPWQENVQCMQWVNNGEDYWTVWLDSQGPDSIEMIFSADADVFKPVARRIRDCRKAAKRFIREIGIMRYAECLWFPCHKQVSYDAKGEYFEMLSAPVSEKDGDFRVNRGDLKENAIARTIAGISARNFICEMNA